MNETSSAPRRWFCATPMTYSEAGRFWVRDTGLVCLGFRKLGLDSRFVALGEPEEHQDMPLITCRPEQMQDADWWRQWQAEVVLLCSWALPRFEPIARAIKTAGSRLYLVLDTDGIISPHVWPKVWLQRKYVDEREGSRWLAWAWTLLKMAVSSFKARHAGIVRHLEHADLIVFPSPLAKQRYSRFLNAVQRPDLAGRLRFAPFSVTPDMVYNPNIPKKPVIIAVGRWQTVVKNAPLLARILEEVLQAHPQYKVRILGEGEDRIRRLMQTSIARHGSRVEIVGYVQHKDLPSYYQDSQIILCPSCFESFHIATAEALCCGCSVVGDVRISSMPYFAQFGSGTLACDLSPTNFRDALFAEIDAWKIGDRDPGQISKIWTAKLHSDHVAEAFLNLA